MPTFDWQLIVALMAVTGAAWFLFRRGARILRAGEKGHSACGTCGSCAAESNSAASPPNGFVSLDALETNKGGDAPGQVCGTTKSTPGFKLKPGVWASEVDRG